MLSIGFETTSNELGAGFLESIYEKTLLVALHEKGLEATAQVVLEAIFRNSAVAIFAADILVEKRVLLELKVVKNLAPQHTA